MNIVNSVAPERAFPCYEAVSEAAQDAYTRLIFPSVERGASLHPCRKTPRKRLSRCSA